MTTQLSLLLTGVGGQLGRRVADHLLRDRADVPVIGTSRTPQRLGDLARRGLQLRHADFDEPGGLVAAFEGAGRLLLISTAAANAGPRRVAQHRAALHACAQAGVRHVAYTSFLDADTSPLTALAADHAATEALLEQGSTGFTVLRHAFYMEMLLSTLPAAIASGRLLSASGQAGAAYVTRADCAIADAAALRDGFDGRRRLDITGPSALTSAQLVERVNAVLGTAIVHVDATRAELEAHFTAGGMPPAMARLLSVIDEGLGQGAMARRSDDFEALCGRRACDVDAFLRLHRDALMAR